MKINDIASPEYRELLRKAHEGTKWGNGGKHHAKDALEFAQEISAASMLDYGCGTGSLARKMKELAPTMPVAEFDPGIPGKDQLPARAGLVVCTDVMEHVEPALVEGVLMHIASLSNCGAYFIIALGSASFILPDGRNAHLSLRTATEWMGSVRRAGFDILRVDGLKGMSPTRRKGLHLWCAYKY